MCLAVSGAAWAGPSGVPRYRVVDIGTFGGHDSAAYAINDRGQVAGWGGGPYWSKHACIWEDGVLHNIDIPANSEAYAINSLGAITGRSINRAIIWDPVQGLRYIGDAQSAVTEGFGLNDRGEVVGITTAGGFLHAFFWDEAGGMRDMGTLAGQGYSRAYAINNSGQAVGYSYIPGGYNGFIWDKDNGMRGLGALPGNNESCASDINDLGDVVGYSHSSDGWRACLWSHQGSLINLGVLPGFRHSYACAVNDLGHVVGYCTNVIGSEFDHSFIWTAETGMLDLKTLVTPGTTREFERASGINSLGQIVGYSAHAYGHGFVLMPVPEPSSLLALACGAAAMAAGSVLRRRCRPPIASPRRCMPEISNAQPQSKYWLI